MSGPDCSPASGSPFRPARTLLVVVVAFLVLAGLVNAGWLLATATSARVGDLESWRVTFRVLRTLWPEALAMVPGAVFEPHQLTTSGQAFRFVGLAVLTHAILGLGLAVTLLPVLVVGRRLTREVPGPFGGWLRDSAYPLGIVALVGIAAVAGPARMVLASVERVFSLPFAAVLFVVLWLTLLNLLRTKTHVRRFLSAGTTGALVLLTIAPLALVVPAPRQPASANGPNILLVSIDSLRPDHLSSYGYTRQTSPVIDQIARDGVRFETVVSPTTWTLPAHMTLLTALSPDAHGVDVDGKRLRADAVSLPEILRRSGYRTAGFVSGPYLDSVYGFSQGFEHYDDYSVVEVTHQRSHRGTTSPQLLERVTGWLAGWQTEGQERPFFMFLHMWDVHYDFTPPPPYDRMFDPDYRGTMTGEAFKTGDHVHPDMDPRDLEHLIALYDGEIRFTDLYLGKVLDTLRRLGVFDDTIVVVTSDHGEEFFEHGEKGHRNNLYDETLLVPLVIRYPVAIPRGRVVDTQVRLMDVAPTILGLAGISQPIGLGPDTDAGHAARDLAPVIHGTDTGSPPPAFGGLHDDPSQDRGDMAVLRTDEMKLITMSGQTPATELYDLVADPWEQRNLSGRRPDIEPMLQQVLQQWIENPAASIDFSEDTNQLSDEHLQRLRSLGYIR